MCEREIYYNGHAKSHDWSISSPKQKLTSTDRERGILQLTKLYVSKRLTNLHTIWEKKLPNAYK